MRIYISGAISDIDYAEAFKNFETAENHIWDAGHDPVNPMKSAGEAEGKTWAAYMAEDVILLDACNGIFMMNNWRESKGARIEHFIAETLGKQIFYEESPLNMPTRKV